MMKKEIIKKDEPCSAKLRSHEIKKQLKEKWGIIPSPDEFEEIIRPWENFIRGYNFINKFRQKERKQLLDRFIAQFSNLIETGKQLEMFCIDLIEYRKLFHLEDKIPTSHNDITQFSQDKIRLLRQIRPLLEVKKSITADPKSLEEAAIINLFVIGEKKYKLHPGKKGRSHENQLVSFAMIISGLSSQKRIENCYKKHRELQMKTELLPPCLLA